MRTRRSPLPAALACALAIAMAATLAAVTLDSADAAGNRSSIRLAVSPTVPVAGHTARLKATVRPAHRRVVVTFSVRRSGHWARLGRARTSSRGIARHSVVFTRPGTYRVRAVAVPRRRHQVTTVRTVRVVAPVVTGSGGSTGSGSGGSGGASGSGGTGGSDGTGDGTQPAGFAFDGDYLTTAGETHTRRDDMSYWRDCTTQVAPVATPTFAAALSAIDAYTASGTSTQAWKDLALADPTRPGREDDVAMIALGVHVPAAALAAFVEGYRDHPTQVYFLNGAAAAANAVGHPEWAIALETEAATLNTSGSTGIPDEAVRLTNLGHAHAMMGDWATAKSLVTKAFALAPHAPQINAELAAVDFCADDAPGASSHYGQSLRTGKPGEDDAVTSTGSGTNRRTSAAKIWDLSRATSPTIELPALPTSPADLVAQADAYDEASNQVVLGFWHTEYNRLQAQWSALQTQENSLWSQFRAESMSPVQRQQINDILYNLYPAADAHLIQLEQDVTGAWDPDVCPAGNDAKFCGGQYYDRDCGLNQSAFDLWHQDMAAWREKFYAYAGEAEGIFAGMRANLADPVAYQLAGALIADHFVTEAQGFVQDVWYKTQLLSPNDNNGNPCWTTPPTDPQPTQVKLDNIDPGVCDPNALKSHVNLAISAGTGFSIKSTCTTVDVEADASVYKFLGGFTSASFNKDGSGVTAVAGVKASGLGATFVSALYITYDRNGEVTDLGWEVGPSFEPGAGPVSLDAGSDVIKISFMSVFESPLTV